MKLIIKILRSERGSVGIGTALLTAGATAAAGAAASKGVSALLDGGDPAAPSLIDPITGQQIQQDRGTSLGALQQQQQFANQLQGAGMQGVDAQQQLLAALQLQAQGGGPNPAQAALNNATGANVANQAALLAGQRGASANAGLIGRQAAMQGAGIQQQAAGQSALMQAQQQLAAQGQLGQLGSQLVGQQGQAIGGLNQMAQGLQGMGLNAAGNRNNAAVGAQGSLNSANAGINQIAAGAAADVAKGGLSAAGNMLLPQGKAHGGEVEGPKAGLKPGDHEDNDIVPVLLSPGEIVVPRSYASDPKAAAAFAHACALFASKKDKK